MLGTSVAHYRIVDRLARGGTAEVYEADDLKLGRKVALKILPLEVMGNPEATRRFEREARAASLLDHPNICTIYDIVESDAGQLCIVMPCYDGEPLRRIIERGPVPIDKAIDYAMQTLRGLATAHASGIVHRDIKPDNLFVRSDGLVKILDFGLAEIAAPPSEDRNSSLDGTIEYMAPERIRNETAGPASDLWSVAVTLYEMLTETSPFRGNYEAAIVYSILQADPAPICARRPAVPLHVERAIRSALEKDPNRRPAGAEAMIEALEGRAATATMQYELVIMGRALPLDEGEHIVGRAHDASIQVAATSISRRHARITIADGQATVEDLQSKNGTFVGGSRISGPVVLRDGEELSFGRVAAMFHSVSVDGTTKTDSGG